jgi:hypothetical protein
VYIDDNMYYAIDSIDVSSYEGEGFGETFWIPKEGVDLLLNMPEDITHYSVTNSFFYAFTDELIVAIKLKLSDQFPSKQAEKILNSYTDFGNTITVPKNIGATLDRIRLATMKDVKGKHMFHMTTGESLVVQSISMNKMTVYEELDYTKNKVKKATYVVSIDNFLAMLKEDNVLHIVTDGKSIALAVHNEKHTHLLMISEA